MEKYISFFIINLVLDFTILVLLSRVFQLKSKRFEIMIIMIFSLTPQLLYMFCGLKPIYFALLKMSFYLFVSLFLTDEYSVKKLFSIFGFLVFLMFSVYGFSGFFVLFVRSVISETSNKNLSPIYSALIVIGLVLYIFLLYLLFSKLAEHKKFSGFLSKVSFSLFGRHIEITGLIDSGNALYDRVTGKSVIIVPLSVIRKYISEGECNMIAERRYFGLNISHELEYQTVGGTKAKMPIVDIGAVTLERHGKAEKRDCVLGIIGENLADKRYECLLHREFI